MPPVGAGVPIESRGYLRSWSGSSSARPEVQGPCRVRPRIPDSSSAHLCIPGSFPVHRCNAGSRSVRPRIPGSLLGLLRIPGSSFVRRCIPGSPSVHLRNAGSSSVHLGAKNGSGWTDREPRFHGRPEPEPGFPSTARTRARHAVNGPNPNPTCLQRPEPEPCFHRPSELDSSFHGRPEPEPSSHGRNPNPTCCQRSKSDPCFPRWTKAAPRMRRTAESRIRSSWPGGVFAWHHQMNEGRAPILRMGGTRTWSTDGRGAPSSSLRHAAR